MLETQIIIVINYLFILSTDNFKNKLNQICFEKVDNKQANK